MWRLLARKKQMGFSLHSCHDHIKIHVCGVLKRNGIMRILDCREMSTKSSLNVMIDRSLGNVYIHLDGD